MTRSRRNRRSANWPALFAAFSCSNALTRSTVEKKRIFCGDAQQPGPPKPSRCGLLLCLVRRSVRSCSRYLSSHHGEVDAREIGNEHVRTPVNNGPTGSRSLLEKK